MGDSFSLNDHLLTPAKVRWQALGDLWAYRHCWRVPAARQAMRAERDTEMAETMPFVLVLALLLGIALFVVLPASLGEQAASVLARLWPAMVSLGAPLGCALMMALLNAPGIALRLTECEAAGEFAGTPAIRSAKSAYRCVPMLVAHSVVCMACTVLLLLFVMVMGLTAELVMDIGDVASNASIVLSKVKPYQWLLGLLNAGLLGWCCVLASVVYAWPGTQLAQRGLDAHRLGLRAMLVSTLACVAAGLGMLWLQALLRMHS